jgi:hypothetical protein
MLERLIESVAELSGLIFMVNFLDSNHHIEHFNSSYLPFFSVKVVLICSETFGLVKAGLTSGKLKVQKISQRVRFAHTIILPFRYQQQQRDKYADISIHSTITMHCVGALKSTLITLEAWTQRVV